MNQTTPLNSELLSADARGRKHIPVAVFAVIIIHVVLFLVLLIAAGCRSSARVKGATPPAPEAAAERNLTPPPATRMANLPNEEATLATTEPMLVTEPEAENQPQTVVEQPARRITQIAQAEDAAPAPKATKAKTNSEKFYVVKAGDTLSEIAQRHGTTVQAVRTANKMKNDMIHPGQKLQVVPEGRTAPLQVRSEKSKRSKEA